MRLLSRNSYVRRGDATVLVENETDDVQADLAAFQAEEKVRLLLLLLLLLLYFLFTRAIVGATCKCRVGKEDGGR
jgi:hypothetical protein